MRLLILEPNADGHRAQYVRWLVQAASRRHWTTLIGTTEAAFSHVTLRALPSEYANVDVLMMRKASVEYAKTSGLLAQACNDVASWRMFKRAIDAARARYDINAIIFPYAEYCFYSLAVLGEPCHGIPWCAISMRLSLARDTSTDFTRLPRNWRLAHRILDQPHLRALFVINPSVDDVPRNWYSDKARSRLRYLPDPAESPQIELRPAARLALSVSERSIVVLVYGWIDGRKGADSLVQTLAQESDLEDFTLILAGEQSEDTRGLMSTAPYRHLRATHQLIVLDRFLSSDEQQSVFAAADVVWLGYRQHMYMSGVLALAGRAGLPVLGTKDGEIGRLIESNGLGIIIALDRLAEIAQALRVMRNAATRKEFGERGRRHFATHTVDNFGDTVLSAFD